MQKRVRGYAFKSLPVRDAVMHRNSNDKLSTLNAYVRRRVEFQLFDLPFFEVERLALIFSCDQLMVNGKPYQLEELSEPAYNDNRYGLAKMIVVLEEVGWIDDQNNLDVNNAQPIELLGGDGGAVIGV
jgi:hypothetical protein